MLASRLDVKDWIFNDSECCECDIVYYYSISQQNYLNRNFNFCVLLLWTIEILDAPNCFGQ